MFLQGWFWPPCDFGLRVILASVWFWPPCDFGLRVILTSVWFWPPCDFMRLFTLVAWSEQSSSRGSGACRLRVSPLHLHRWCEFPRSDRHNAIPSDLYSCWLRLLLVGYVLWPSKQQVETIPANRLSGEWESEWKAVTWQVWFHEWKR